MISWMRSRWSMMAAHLHWRLAPRRNREPSFVDAPPERDPEEEEDSPEEAPSSEEHACGAARREGASRFASGFAAALETTD
jgi:hypothetical protein